MDELRKVKSMGEQHENVLLLAMSTLPRQPKINTYKIEDGAGTLYFKSLSQMEPHTKCVLYMLATRGEKLDRIVILESSKVREEKPENWKQETATSLFAKRICNYLGRHEEVGIEVADELENLKESSCDWSIYEEGLPGIITIDLDNSVFFWEAAKAIRGSERGKRIHLYMDMQGGDRNAVSQMNAIAELLGRQNVIIQGRFANDFEPKREKPLHTIRDASREYRTYELISAMDIFARYGRGDKLEEYFRESGSGDTKEKKLVEAIQEASLAISRCSGDGFDSAVQKIEQLEKEFENPDTITEMDVVYEDIFDDYKPLLTSKYRYVAQILWCLDKQFLQQALTILEAKMPCEFVRSGLLYYLTTDEDREKFLEKCEEIYKELPEKERYRMKDLNHYLLKDYFFYNYKQKFFWDPKKLLKLKFGLNSKHRKEVGLLWEDYKDICRLRNQINHAADGRHDPDGFFCYMKERALEKDSTWNEDTRVNVEERIRRFLDDWTKLADQVPEETRRKIVDLS